MSYVGEPEPFVALPVWVLHDPRIGAREIVVYAALKHHWNRRTGQCNPSHSQISQTTGGAVSPRGVRRALEVLEELEIVAVIPNLKGGQHSNTYLVAWTLPEPSGAVGQIGRAVASGRPDWPRAVGQIGRARVGQIGRAKEQEEQENKKRARDDSRRDPDADELEAVSSRRLGTEIENMEYRFNHLGEPISEWERIRAVEVLARTNELASSLGIDRREIQIAIRADHGQLITAPAEEIPCPTCGALGAAPCMTAGGRVLRRAHSRRYQS